MNRTGTLLTVLTVGTLASGMNGLTAADDIVLRSSTEPSEAWVGQRIILNVDVLGADGWAQITRMESPDIPGAYVMRTESQGVRLGETLAGTTYTGQRYAFSVYCQREGSLQIPSLPVTVVVKQWGVNATERARQMAAPSTSLQCRTPPGAEGIRGLISTTRLEADQDWSSRPATVAPGAAVTRTVSLRAEDVSGMAFPPMQHPEIEGVSVYPGQPSVSDETQRGVLRGQREDSVTYVFEQPGEVALPAIVLSWWDVSSERLRRIELPGLELVVEGTIAPEPSAAPAAAATTSPRDRWFLAAGGGVLLAFGLWLGRRLGRWAVARRKSWQASEAAAFRDATRAMRSGDARKISAAVMRWLDRVDTGTQPARLDRFLEDHGDDATRTAAGELARALASGEPFAAGTTLRRGLDKARARLRRARRARRMAEEVLPELNVARRLDRAHGDRGR